MKTTILFLIILMTFNLHAQEDQPSEYYPPVTYGKKYHKIKDFKDKQEKGKYVNSLLDELTGYVNRTAQAYKAGELTAEQAGNYTITSYRELANLLYAQKQWSLGNAFMARAILIAEGTPLETQIRINMATMQPKQEMLLHLEHLLTSPQFQKSGPVQNLQKESAYRVLADIYAKAEDDENSHRILDEYFHFLANEEPNIQPGDLQKKWGTYNRLIEKFNRGPAEQERAAILKKIKASPRIITRDEAFQQEAKAENEMIAINFKAFMKLTPEEINDRASEIFAPTGF